MTRKLPQITYKKKKYFVDFKFSELRSVKTATPIKFTDLPEGKYSRFKAKLRGLRSRTYGGGYIRGLDD